MQQLVLVLACIAGTVLCITRRKKYNHSYIRMAVIFVLFSISGALGSNFGSALAGGALIGRRLYGLMMADTLTLFVLSYMLKIKTAALGDYVAPPILSSCVGAKFNCLLDDCCYGFVMFHDTNNPVRFPSQLFEMFLWLLLILWLLRLEKRGSAQGILWPLAMIWFGLTRCFADFFRGVPSEKEIFFAGLPAGAFWSLVLTAMGLTFLFFSIREKTGEIPTFKQYMRAVAGKVNI